MERGSKNEGSRFYARRECQYSGVNEYVSIYEWIENLPSKRMANWLRTLAQLGTGMVHFWVRSRSAKNLIFLTASAVGNEDFVFMTF